jgi:cytochrome c-type biogenesis protein CcmF
VGGPFYNNVAVPIGLFLLLLTGVGPLLPWRSTSMKAIKRNFILPTIALWGMVAVCLVVGVRPWKDGALDNGSLYSLVAFALSAAVLTAILSEFLRGARVIARQSGRNFFAAMYLLVRRNTRRYGGYIIHVGIVIMFIGFAGAAFNRNVEGELALHGKLMLSPYTLECVGFTQDSNANYDSEYALIDVFRNGRQEEQLSRNGSLFHVIPLFHMVPLQMAPEKRVYHASGQPQTMVAIHSAVPGWDLYVVYEGTNPDTGQPIIKAYFNPLVNWIWLGFGLLFWGTLIALVPSQKPGQKGGNSVAS